MKIRVCIILFKITRQTYAYPSKYFLCSSKTMIYPKMPDLAISSNPAVDDREQIKTN